MITKAWSLILRKRAAAPALLDEAGGVLRTFAEIEAEAAQWRDALRGIGAERGEVLVIQIGNRPEGFALLLAAWRESIAVVPLGMHIGEQERLAILETSGATLLLRRDESLVRLGPPRDLWQGGEPPALLKLTSGTTAAPRIIRFSERALLEDCLQICETMGITNADLNYGVIPVSHSYGFSNLVTPLLACGVPMVLSEDRMPRAILNGLNATRATVFPGMPIFYDKLAALEGETALPALRLAISAGAPLTPEVGERFTRRFGVKIHTFYGSSECGGIGYDAEEAPIYREGFVGRPLSRAGVTLGEGGKLTVCGPTVGDGYWSALGPVAQEGISEGCFQPDDLLRETPEGFYLFGRASDMINIAGRKLNPREVEARLSAFPGVREIVVFGVSSPLRHEEAIACFCGEAEPEALARHARTVLSGWQVPKDFWCVPEIPRSERGKISRRELAEAWRSVRG